uniref:Uncharacterized protein n=1 Tax=Lepeophtheirus salmonis TaxID=72036 RepID=A0A0K2UD80_LEPSM
MGPIQPYNIYTHANHILCTHLVCDICRFSKPGCINQSISNDAFCVMYKSDEFDP